MFNTIINWYKSLNTNKLDIYFDRMDSKLESISIQCEDIKDRLTAEINELTAEVDKYRSMVDAIANAIPDMLWFKDIDGKYIYANQAIKDGLLLDDIVIGKTDVELATQAKKEYGNHNHTFGEKCKNSDLVVLASLKSQRFMESGKVKGDMLYLEVYKAPFFVNGELKGVVGTGRDMTVYKQLVETRGCNNCDILKLYEFEPDSTEN